MRRHRLGAAERAAPNATIPLAVAVCGSLALASLIPSHRGEARRRDSPVIAAAAFDTSWSDSTNRQLHLSVFNRVVAELCATPFHLGFISFDRSARKLFDSPVSRPADVLPMENGAVLKRKRSARDGTSLAAGLRLVKAFLDAHRGQPSVLFIATDGEDVEPVESKALASSLALNPGICAVWVVGVKEDGSVKLRSHIDDCFAPFGSDRLIVSSDNEIPQGLRRFRHALPGGR